MLDRMVSTCDMMVMRMMILPQLIIVIWIILNIQYMQLTISSMIVGSLTSLYSSQYPAECFHPHSYGAVLFLSHFWNWGNWGTKRLSHSSWSHSRDGMQTVQLQKRRGSPLVLSTFSVVIKNVLRFLDTGAINVQGGLGKMAKIN